MDYIIPLKGRVRGVRGGPQVDLLDVAARLRSAGAYRGLVALCARLARARDPRDECLRPEDHPQKGTIWVYREDAQKLILAICFFLFFQTFEPNFLTILGRFKVPMCVQKQYV